MSQSSANTDNLPHCIVDDRWFDTTVVVCCSGVLDMLTAPVLERHIASTLAKKPTAMVIDLTGVDFLASAGMGVLIATHDALSPTTSFSVVANGPVTSRPMRLIGLDSLMTLHPTLVDALADLETPDPVSTDQP
ncbi:STAS domain-containing protein [soil metagenome]